MEEITVLTKSQLEEVIFTAIQKAVAEKEVTKKCDEKRWLTNKDVSEMLSVTPRTLQNLRDRGEIGFSKVGSKIFYKREDIENLLEAHSYVAFAKERRK